MKKWILAVLIVLTSTAAFALPINDRLEPLDPGPGDGGELSVQQILDGITGGAIDAVEDQSNVAIWHPSDFAQSAFKVSYLTGSTGVFGIYSYSTGLEINLFEKTESGIDGNSGPQSATFLITPDGSLVVNNDWTNPTAGFGSSFGFYWNDGKTEDDKNQDNAIMALTYQLPVGTSIDLPILQGITDDDNDWIMAFGDQGSLIGDDFNDLVVLVQDIAATPEPGTLLLLGSGMLGMAYLRKRKKA
jgi:hypothetical protein